MKALNALDKDEHVCPNPTGCPEAWCFVSMLEQWLTLEYSVHSNSILTPSGVPSMWEKTGCLFTVYEVDETGFHRVFARSDTPPSDSHEILSAGSN